ncbi:MAG: hypothetical protein ACXVI6_08180 [Candidatus Aminicenantales bacterium]
MAITSFTFDRGLADSFIGFGYDVYRGDRRWIPPFRAELDRQLSPSFPFYLKAGSAHRHFLAMAGDRVLGRVSAMVNPDLRDAGGSAPGLIGFFECFEDRHVAQDLLATACAWLRQDCGVTRVTGPMNFDIWHGYRIMTRGFDKEPFLGEPYNKPYYPGFFEEAGFVRRQRWHSVECEGRGLIESLMARGGEAYEKLRRQGYVFESFDAGRFEQEMGRLHGLISKSFSRFLDFTPISAEEFLRLFSHSRLALVPRLAQFFNDERGQPAGFAVAFLELADAVRAMRGKTDLASRLKFAARRARARRVNFFAGGMTSEEIAKKSGLGRAGFYSILRQILEEGYEHVLITLISEDNRSNGFLGPLAKDYGREYALYELRP